VTPSELAPSVLEVVPRILLELGLSLDKHPVGVHVTNDNRTLILSVGIADFDFPVRPLQEAIVEIADELQNQAIDIHFRAVPQCVDGHFHPPRAELVENEAMWICPRSGMTVRRIGRGTTLDLEHD